MRTRKKRGGSPVPGINFILLDIEKIRLKYSHPLLNRRLKKLEELTSMPEFSEYHIERIDPENLDHMLQLYVIDTETTNIVCIISFIINDENIGYIHLVTCDNKIEKYKPSSYLAFYEVFKILEQFNISYCYLTVVPDQEKYWKLYNFYGNIGFQCLPVDKSGRGKIENVKQLSANNRNMYLKTRKNTFLKNKNQVITRNIKNSEDYIYNCNDMIGNVKEILIKLKTTLNIE